MSKDVWKKYVTSISALDFMNTAWNNPRIMKKRKRKEGRGGGGKGDEERGEKKGAGLNNS